MLNMSFFIYVSFFIQFWKLCLIFFFSASLLSSSTLSLSSSSSIFSFSFSSFSLWSLDLFSSSSLNCCLFFLLVNSMWVLPFWTIIFTWAGPTYSSSNLIFWRFPLFQELLWWQAACILQLGALFLSASYFWTP